MKTFPILILLTLIVAMSTNRANTQTEHQSYTLVQKFPGFEVRYYPEAILATVSTGTKSYREMTSPSFNALAGYIFGSNETGQKIAMTAPVHIDFNDNGSRMSFVMPSAYNMDDLPRPNNQAVSLEKTQPAFYAAITFGGYASDETIKEYSEKLAQLLRQNHIGYHGNFSFLGYISPYKFWNRRNEVVVRIVWE